MSNTAKTYFVQLTPLSTFFFGNEQGETADYYVKGNNFPQQTALLGLMRHQLLIQNKLLANGSISDKAKADTLIGPESFRYNRVTGFGVIEQISPCCIIDAENNYWPIPPAFAGSVYEKNGHVVFPDYDPKKIYSLQLGAQNKKPVYDDDIFMEAERPGIAKPYKESIEEKSYYKQVWLKMKNRFGFGFFITVDGKEYEEDEVILRSSMVTFGKEAAVFKMTVSEAPALLPPHQPGANAVVLLSDTYADSQLLGKCAVAVSDNISFRNVVNSTTQHKKDYYNKRPADTNAVRLQLIKKGSMLFAGDQVNEVCGEIDRHTQFVKTGYNHYQKIKINIQP